MNAKQFTLPEDTPPLSLLERRARRQERRDKQRQANAGRAAKMHAARLEFQHEAVSLDELPLLNVGCSGWFYWHWRGSFYPQASATKNWFAQYADTFPTVELNAPFYSWPTVNAVKQWVRQAGDHPFVYTVKACELLTHVKKFTRTKTLVKDFCFIADLLGKHMGCFLFQFPPSFHYTPARLKNIVSQLDPSRRNVLEFRHKSWWNSAVYAALQKCGAIFCSCSAPRLPDELITTADEVYIRFHGPEKWYRHDYTEAELAVWARRIDESKCKRAWVYFNNDRDAFAIKNAKALTRQLSAIKRFQA
ncbi:MAG: hypothetical protein JWO94_2424 [Verrucomicrobiaceae bacterium]|nr:hypothetical protein [Verrucomicrobiaceae bacterium]